MEIQRPPPAAAAVAAAVAMSAVLGDDNLLREILLRLGLPTSLLRGALVCRRWLRHASDPTFLSRFRDRHPPRVLGVYLDTAAGRTQRPRFVPIRPLSELAAAARRAGSFFDDAFRGSSAFVHDSRGGRLLVTAVEHHYGHCDSTHLVCSPLSPAGDTVVVPPPPTPPPVQLTSPQDSVVYHYGEFLPDDGDGRSYFCVLIGYGQQQITVHLYELRDMNWIVRASAAAQLPVSQPKSRVMLFDNAKFYMLSTINKILVCDFPSSSISAMELPNGVDIERSGCIMLSRAVGCGIYLIHVNEFQLRIFRSDDAGNWSLLDSICLHKMRANLGMADWPSLDGQSDGIKIRAVGENAMFVFLEMFCTIVFLDITNKQAEKVYEMTPEDKVLVSVRPLVLAWPPVFPRPKEGYVQKN